MFLINAHPTRGRLLEYGRLIERGVYKIITGKRGAFIGDGRLKERGRLLEKIRTPIVGKNSLHCCVFLYDHCFRNVLCIVLNKFYCILFRRCFQFEI